MNDLKRSTITSMEVAEMMETEHSKIMRKLEGSKDRRGYIAILSEAQMGVADYFIKSSYVDAQGKERPCYEVTKLGCDFLANKSTGEKGVLFTARYVKRFCEMEHQVKQIPITEHPGEVANLIKVLSSRMDKISRRGGYDGSTKKGDDRVSEKEKRDIQEMVENAKILAERDPQAFMIAKSNMDILKARSDLEKAQTEKEEQPV